MNFYENLLINEINYIVSSKQTLWMVSIILIDLLKSLRKMRRKCIMIRPGIMTREIIFHFIHNQFNQSVHCLLTLFVGILQLFIIVIIDGDPSYIREHWSELVWYIVKQSSQSVSFINWQVFVRLFTLSTHYHNDDDDDLF